jgi:SAM-dependent methyltransferase
MGWCGRRRVDPSTPTATTPPVDTTTHISSTRLRSPPPTTFSMSGAAPECPPARPPESPSPGDATGIDLSARMLDEARRRSDAAGLANTTFVQGDAQVHPFQPAAADVVISRLGAMFFGDPAAAFSNLTRALRSGGRLALLTWQELANNDWVLTLRDTLAAGRSLPEPPANAPGPFGLADPSHIRGVLTTAGFDDIELTDVREPMYVGADTDDALEFVTGLSHARALLGGLDDHTRHSALEALRNRLAAHTTPNGVLLGAAGWLITAHRI